MGREELLSRMSDDTKQYIDRVMELYDAPFARQMGIEIESIKVDEVVCTMKIEPFMMNSMARVHGAAIYALMDHTFGVISHMHNYGTGQSTEVKYYRPATTDLRCVGRIINISRSLGVFEVKAYSTEGKLIASATCTQFIIKEGQ